MGNSSTRSAPTLPSSNVLSANPTSNPLNAPTSSSIATTKPESSSTTTFGRNIARQRFYNAHHTWNETLDGSGNDTMFEFIRECQSVKEKCTNLSIFYLVIDQCLESVRSLSSSSLSSTTSTTKIPTTSKMATTSKITKTTSTTMGHRVRTKKVIRCMRLLSAWMTLAINNNKLWVFRELGVLVHSVYDDAVNVLLHNPDDEWWSGTTSSSSLSSMGSISRIEIDYERIMGDLLCLCTLKRRLSMIKFLAHDLSIDVNLTCEGGESPLIICAEHNLPEIALFLLHCGADANCNIYLASDSSNSPAQIASSWQHLKVLYYLILFGARSNYFNVHLRSVEEYAKDNHLINYIVQKALSLRLVRNKRIQRILYQELCHPLESPSALDDDDSHHHSDSDDVDYFQFPMVGGEESDSTQFHISSTDDDEHINHQIRCNIDRSMKFMKWNNHRIRKRNSLSLSSRRRSEQDLKTVDPEKVYLLKDIVNIIYAMITVNGC